MHKVLLYANQYANISREHFGSITSDVEERRSQPDTAMQTTAETFDRWV